MTVAEGSARTSGWVRSALHMGEGWVRSALHMGETRALPGTLFRTFHE